MRKSLLIHPDELSEKWILRAKELRLDTLALHPRGGKRAAESLAEMLTMLETAEYRALLDRAAEAGLSIEYEFHAAGYLLPREEFENHPEWFRMDENGERVRDLNFCFTNPDAVDFVSKRAAELAKKLYRSTHMYYFWMDDVKDSMCRCPACREQSEPDLQLHVLNAILRELRREIPDARLAYLAYFGTMGVPETEKPEDGIFLEYAPFDRDPHKPMREQTDHDSLVLPSLISFFGKENAKVLEYWFDNSMYSGWQKPPKAFSADDAVVKDDLCYYRSLGFETLSSFACYLGSDYEALYGEPDLSCFAGGNEE